MIDDGFGAQIVARIVLRAADLAEDILAVAGAPANLVVPEYDYVSDTRVKIG